MIWMSLKKIINKSGGLKKNNGVLENKRNQIKKKKWKEYGIEEVDEK